MSRLIFFILSFLFLVSPKGFAESQEAHLSWMAEVQEIGLKNGMTFLIFPRPSSPIFSASLRFRVGGLEEEEGKRGLAHFLEHMAFKGTKTLGTSDFEKEKPILDKIEKVGEELAREYKKAKQDPHKIRELKQKLQELHQEESVYIEKEYLARRMLENGGQDYNASTSMDVTTYYVSLPADKLRFWAELESQRIFYPVFREFYQEKDVVLEERRMRIDNDPDGRLYEAFLEKAFTQSPYRWLPIGHEADLQGLTVADLQVFFEKYYTPSRMVGALVGKLDLKETRKILEDTFGKISPRESPSPEIVTEEKSSSKEKRVDIKQKARPRLLLGYHKPTLPSRDDSLFDLLDPILGSGRSSRLYKRLVVEEKIASAVGISTGTPGVRLPNLFTIEINLLEEGRGAITKALAVVDEEIQKIQREGISESEFQKAKNQILMAFLGPLQTNEGLASQLSYFQSITGDWRYLEKYYERLQAFQKEDLQELAQKYLQTQNRTVAVLHP